MDRIEQSIILIATTACIVLFAVLFLCGCQQVPYRDVIYYGDPKQPVCDVILDDGFDQICIQIQIETRVEIREVEVPGETNFVEVPGEKVFVEVPVEKVEEVIRVVEVPGETIYVEGETVYVPGETIYVEGETVYVEVPVEKIVEVKEIIEVEKIVYLPTVYHLRFVIPEKVTTEPVDFEEDEMSGTVTVEDDLVKVETPGEDIYTPVEDEVVVEIPDMETPDVVRPDGNYCVTIRYVNDSLQSGVTHSDYLHIDGLEVTWTGDDGEVHQQDVTRTVLAVECGYSYEQASERARTIFDDFE